MQLLTDEGRCWSAPSALVKDHAGIPRGSEAHIQMVDAKKSSPIQGKAEAELEPLGLVLCRERRARMKFRVATHARDATTSRVPSVFAIDSDRMTADMREW